MDAHQCRHCPASGTPSSLEATHASERSSRARLLTSLKSKSNHCRRFPAKPRVTQARSGSAGVPCSCAHGMATFAICKPNVCNLTSDRVAQTGELGLAIGDQPHARFPAQPWSVAVCSMANVSQPNRVHMLHRANMALPPLSARSRAVAEGRNHGSMALVRHPTPSRWSCGSGHSSCMLGHRWPRMATWDALFIWRNSIAICHVHETLQRVLIIVRDKPGLCCGHDSDLNFLSQNRPAVHAVQTVLRHALVFCFQRSERACNMPGVHTCR
jgi:hypothetical protein